MRDNPVRYFNLISKHRMINQYYPKLMACIEIICYEELWRKPSDKLNSIGEITLHIVEHIQRNTVRLRQPDIHFPIGIEHHFPRVSCGKSDVIQSVNRAFQAFEKAIDEAAADRIQMYDLYHLVEHTGYHLGQIVDRTQALTSHQFQFVQNGLCEKMLKGLIDQDIKESV